MSKFLDASEKHTTEDDPWLSVADLMAGLMVIFLFIAVIYIRPLIETQTKIKQVTTQWENAREKIYDALDEEFTYDLRIWDAGIDKKTLTIRFQSPDILFKPASAELNERFKNILDTFIPRYLNVLRDFEENIQEIRIEGHTSSEWSKTSTELDSYFKNMELSQARTRSVLEYSLSKNNIYTRHEWAHSLLTANGLSFSQKILGSNGLEDKEHSRRVDFRVRTNAEEKIGQIIESLK